MILSYISIYLFVVVILLFCIENILIKKLRTQMQYDFLKLSKGIYELTYELSNIFDGISNIGEIEMLPIILRSMVIRN